MKFKLYGKTVTVSANLGTGTFDVMLLVEMVPIGCLGLKCTYNYVTGKKKITISFDPQS